MLLLLSSTPAVHGCGEPEWSLQDAQQSEAIVYFPLPAELNGKYQSFTEADLQELRALGYADGMTSLEAGVRHYVQYLQGDAKVLIRAKQRR